MNSKLMLALVLPLGMALNLRPSSAAALDAARVAPLAAIPDGPTKEAGILIGEDAAAVIPLLRVGDGWDATVPYTPGTNPEDWQPAPRAYAATVLPGWGQLTPFGLEEGSQFRLSPPPALHTGKYANGVPTLCLPALFAPSQGQPPGGGSDNSVTTTVIYPVATWSGGCMISGNVKAIITATPNISGTAGVVLKVKPMGCNGSCGMVNGQFTASTTVTIGASVAISGTLKSNYPHCDFSYASAVCGFVVNADGTATINSMVLHTGCFE